MKDKVICAQEFGERWGTKHITHIIMNSQISGGLSKYSKTGVEPDLAALLWGEVDDLLLPLDAGSSGVALTRLGDWGLCKKHMNKTQLGLVTNKQRLC